MSGAYIDQSSSAAGSRIGAGTVVLVSTLFVAGGLFRYAIYAWSFGNLSFADHIVALCTWDCPSYVDIAEAGYDTSPRRGSFSGTANWAFFPLYPSLIASFRAVTGASLELGGYVVSNTATLAAAFAARPLFGADGRAYWLFVFVLFLGPFAVLLTTVHTESVFVLLTILSLVALQRRHYVWSGVWSALLSATRVTGVLFVFALITQVIVDHLREGKTWWTAPSRILGDPRVLLGILLAPLGLFIYMAYLRVHGGDGFGFARVQIGWERELGNPLVQLWGTMFPSPPFQPQTYIALAWGWGALFGFVLGIVLVLQRQYAAAVFCLLALAVSLSAGVTSMLRFTVGLAPLGIALAIMLAHWRPLYYLAFVATLIASVPVTIGWYRYSWLLM